MEDIGRAVITKTRCSCWKGVLCCFLVIVTIVCSLIIVLSTNAYLMNEGFKRITVDSKPVYLNLSTNEIMEQAKRLGGGIKIPTISTHDKNERPNYLEAIKDLHAYIVSKYPNIHQAEYIERMFVNNYSLIYRVEGTSGNKRVYMLCGHLDVAPTPRRKLWDYNPFLGDIANKYKCSYCAAEDSCPKKEDDKYIHGRGAIDTKNVVFGILEVVEHLVKNNIRPSTTFYIAFSHDEEIGGMEGAKHIKTKMMDMLQEKGESIDFILDEGTPVVKNYFSFVKYPLIYISVTEAGSATLKLDLNSMPIDTTNTTLKKERCNQSRRLNNAMKKIVNKLQPFRYGDGPEYDTWRYVSFYMNEFVPKIIASNVWLFSRLIASGLIDPKQVNTRNYKI